MDPAGWCRLREVLALHEFAGWLPSDVEKVVHCSISSQGNRFEQREWRGEASVGELSQAARSEERPWPTFASLHKSRPKAAPPVFSGAAQEEQQSLPKASHGPQSFNMASDDEDEGKTSVSTSAPPPSVLVQATYRSVSSSNNEWSRYDLDGSAGVWFSNSHDTFREDEPGAWTQYTDPHAGRCYWYNQETEEWFYADEGD